MINLEAITGYRTAQPDSVIVRASRDVKSRPTKPLQSLSYEFSQVDNPQVTGFSHDIA